MPAKADLPVEHEHGDTVTEVIQDFRFGVDVDRFQLRKDPLVRRKRQGSLMAKRTLLASVEDRVSKSSTRNAR